MTIGEFEFVLFIVAELTLALITIIGRHQRRRARHPSAASLKALKRLHTPPR